MAGGVQSEIERKNMEAAAQLVQLAVDDSETVEQVLAELAGELARENLAALDAMRDAESVTEAATLRARHVRRIAALMVEAARQLADVGVSTRARFSRLLTERLASGSHELLDAYQSFFKVLPSQNAEAIELMRHALSRSEEALEDALQLATPAPSVPLPAVLPPPAPSHLSQAASGR